MRRRIRVLSTLALAALLVAQTGCSSKAPSSKTETDEKTKTDGSKTAPTEDPLTALDDRTLALVRVQSFGKSDGHIRDYVPSAQVGTGKAPQFLDLIEQRIGPIPRDVTRLDGNLEAMVFASPEGEPLDWSFYVPVSDPEAFASALGAQEDPTEVGLLSMNANGQNVYLNTKQIDYPSKHTTDGAKGITIASTRDVALYSPALVARHSGEQLEQFHATWWPRRSGVAGRYGAMADELRSLLSVNGHALDPARAAVINLESLLYSEAGEPLNWPEKIVAVSSFKIRNNKEGKPYAKAMRLHAFVDASDSPRLLKLWSSMEANSRTNPPPMPRDSGHAVIKLNRSDIEQGIEALVPPRYRMLIAAKGEDVMRSFIVSFDKLMEFNRGATGIALFEQRYPLSVEALFAFDAMDPEEVARAASQTQMLLVERILKPMHLGSLPDVETRAFKDKKLSLSGESATFEIPGPKGKSVTLGSCWANKDGSLYAYVGVDPCDALSQKLSDLVPFKDTFTFTASFPLADVLNTLYVGPNQRVDALAKVDSTLTVTVTPQLVDDKKTFFIDFVTDKKTLGEASGVIPELDEVWSYASSYDVTSLASRAAVEQAIYQEPGVMVVGPPGLLGALPPSYFLGLPFSVPPAPPKQLREALVEPEQ